MSSIAQNLRIAAVLLVFLLLIDVISLAYADKVQFLPDTSITSMLFYQMCPTYVKIFPINVTFLKCYLHRIMKMCVASASVHPTETSVDISTKRMCPRKTGETDYCIDTVQTDPCCL